MYLSKYIVFIFEYVGSRLFEINDLIKRIYIQCNFSYFISWIKFDLLLIDEIDSKIELWIWEFRWFRKRHYLIRSDWKINHRTLQSFFKNFAAQTRIKYNWITCPESKRESLYNTLSRKTINWDWFNRVVIKFI